MGKGYDITADEARVYLEANVGRELTDDELDNVAGGTAVAVALNVTQAWVTTQAATASLGQTAEVAAVEAVVDTQAVAVVA